MPGPLPVGDVAAVHRLAATDNGATLRAALQQGGRVVVAGGGFRASETASVARAMNCEVTLLVPDHAPLRDALGEYAGAVAALHRRRGVRVLADARVTDIRQAGDSLTVFLDDGWQLPADRVVLCDDAEPTSLVVADIHGSRVELAGDVSLADSSEVLVGSVAAGSFVAVCHRRGQPVAVLGVNQPQQFQSIRQKLATNPNLVSPQGASA